jgi:hypothetical protein
MFQRGDTVMLHSGGFHMTVAGVPGDQNGPRGEVRRDYRVVFATNGGRYYDVHIPEIALKLVKRCPVASTAEAGSV